MTNGGAFPSPPAAEGGEMAHDDDDYTVVYLAGFHKRDDEIKSLRSRIAEMEGIIEIVANEPDAMYAIPEEVRNDILSILRRAEKEG
jgi:hypothetical protein